jgi:hypothetical protein
MIASAQIDTSDATLYAADAADSAQGTRQVSKPTITFLPSSKPDSSCGSGKRATLVKFSDGEKIGETEKNCIPKATGND